VADQERARHLLPAALPLPHHDRLMADATVFRNASAVSNLCSMARGVLYTGLTPQHSGLWENTPAPYAGGLRGDVPTLGTMMQDAGYRTAYFGKWHLTHFEVDEVVGRATMARTFHEAGFEVSDQAQDYDGPRSGWHHDPRSASSAARFLHDQTDTSRPWFAAVNFVNPHDIMFFATGRAQTDTRQVHYPAALRTAPPDPLYDRHWGFDLPEAFGEATLNGKPPAQREMQRVTAMLLGEIPFDRQDLWRRYHDYYANCVCDLDRSLGVVLDALEASGQADDTVVVYVADHGEMAGVHGLRDKGGNLYREDQNIPFYVRHPDVPGTVSDALVSQLDLVPTVLGLAGIRREAVAAAYPALRGHDLTPWLGTREGPRDAVLLQWTSLLHLSTRAMQTFADVQNRRLSLRDLQARVARPHRMGLTARGHMRGLVTRRYKFARYFSPLEHHTPTSIDALTARNDLELYDLEADPCETTNLAAHPDAYRSRIEALNARLNALVADEVGKDDGSYLPGPRSWWAA
jgi:arylsulfatase